MMVAIAEIIAYKMYMYDPPEFTDELSAIVSSVEAAEPTVASTALAELNDGETVGVDL